MSSGIRVIHLVWAPLGTAVLADFLRSYAAHPAGREHELLVLFNGFGAERELGPLRELLAGVEHEELRLPEPVLDLAAYLEATRSRPAERYCFLNSYAEPLADGWLATLDSALGSGGAGIIGATGSWGSIRSYQRYMLGLGGPYGRVFDERRATNETLAAVAASAPSAPAPKTRREPLRFARTLLEQAHGFEVFPAAHIRTNGFMISAEVLGRLRTGSPARKSDAYRLESGRHSFTAQVRAIGLAARVVTRTGHVHEPDQWPASLTFWRGEQENLLIADNQTRLFRDGDPNQRRTLARFAWGAEA